VGKGSIRERDKPRRFRDPIYDLYTFDGKNDVDRLALDLVDTPAFQRLRRIKQLGFADHVYPAASHSRFAHSLGVYAAAQKIVAALRDRGMHKDLLDAEEADDALIGALLHDIGHGPFSHAFEKVHEALGVEKSHEDWTREIIRGAGTDKTILDLLGDDRARRVAELLEGKRRSSCWSAIISSAFDADRLDYVQRDRFMSGTGTGAIDFTWLLEHVRIATLDDPTPVRTFAVNRRALQQAETFLLARYQLYEQVYFHKICRGFEALLVVCLTGLAALAEAGRSDEVGLPASDLLVQHLLHPSLDTYLRIDDGVINSALQRVTSEQLKPKASREALRVYRLATQIISRIKLECLDLEQWASLHGKQYVSVVRCARRFAEKELGLKLGDAMFLDEPTLSVYGKRNRENVPIHKRIWIDIDEKHPVEITEVSGVIRGQPAERKLGRLFFMKRTDRDETQNHLSGQLDNLPNVRRRR
jgi:HD superfamily phosphohydrolase